MKDLLKYSLDFKRTITFLQDNLEKTNTLSQLVLDHINFAEGKFFTLLPPFEAKDLDSIYQFQYGGKGEDVRKKTQDILLKKLKYHPEWTCVFDDATCYYEESLSDPFFQERGVHLGKEVYYILPAKESSSQLLEKCFQYSNSLWHSLCVITKDSLSIRKNHSLLHEDILSFVRLAEQIILGAYDMEGYIFWERTYNLNSGF